MKKGFFISFEGVDGVGKTTQVEILEKKLKEKNYDVLITKEPCGSEFAKSLINFVNNCSEDIDINTELFLMQACRNDHLQKVLIPALKDKYIVICDRFIDSTLVYQGFSVNEHPNHILRIHQMFFKNIMPDLTFVLDANIDFIKNRLEQRVTDSQNKYDQIKIEDIELRRQAFLYCADLFEDRSYIINAENSINHIAEKIFSIVSKKISFFE